MAVSSKPAIIVLTGASGAGKTTILLALADLQLTGVECINCDRVNLEMDKSVDPSDRQAAVLRHWIREMKDREDRVCLAVLDTQIRPHQALEVIAEEGINNFEIVLVDCDPNIRNQRLVAERQQPELVNHRMDCWAAYLRGQADALKLPIIDTTKESVETGVKHLLSIANHFRTNSKQDQV